MEIAIPMPDVIGNLQKRLLSSISQIVDEWAGLVPELTRWEDEHLLDNPTPENLAAHKAALDRMLLLIRWLNRGSEAPDFPDRQLAESVAATQQIILDKLRMWHGPRMSKADSDR